MSDLMTECEIDDLPSLGWLRFVGRGEENTYWELSDGAVVYVKGLTADVQGFAGEVI